MVPQSDPYLLLIETATENCSVALSSGSVLLGMKENRGIRDQAAMITTMIRGLLEECEIEMEQLDAVVLSEGPGSYTSLRVGMSTAKGICFGLKKPMISVNTLESIALVASKVFPEHELICPMIDARRMEVYASLYKNDMTPLMKNVPVILNEQVFDKYLIDDLSMLICGNGGEKSKALFESKNILVSGIECSAKNLLEPGLIRYYNKDFADLAYFSPNYIKSPNITKAKKKLL